MLNIYREVNLLGIYILSYCKGLFSSQGATVLFLLQKRSFYKDMDQ